MQQEIAVLIQNNFDDFKVNSDLKSLLERAVVACIKSFGHKNLQLVKSLEISINFIDDKEMCELNSAYRKIDKTTDVLSFSMFDDFENIAGDFIALGDIAISVPVSAKQADELNHSLNREIIFLAIHGTLHLLGFDHEKSQQDDEQMQKMQEEILQNLEI